MLDYPYQNHTTNLQQVFILICVQKIYFIPHFFLKILQRNSKLVILGNLGMAGHTYLKLQQQFDEIFDVYLWTFILHIFLVILQRYCKLMVLGTLGMPGQANPKRYYKLVENFCAYLQAKNQLHPPCFSGDIAKICRHLILGFLGMTGCTHPT